jgi:hypothetical protein
MWVDFQENIFYFQGIRLCSFLLLEKLKPQAAWELIRSYVVLHAPSQWVSIHKYSSVYFRKLCENIGWILRKAFENAKEVVADDDDAVKRSDIAFQIFRSLMEHCILVKRQHADRFCTVGYSLQLNKLITVSRFSEVLRLLERTGCQRCYLRSRGQ